MNKVDVIKLNLQRNETWRYTAQVLSRSEQAILLEAYFNRDDLNVHGLVMGRGDRFVEIYYSDRWYNIFEIYARDGGELKGWYCNINLPAEIGETSVAYVDLALDLLVFPDGRQQVLDQEEFDALQLPGEMRAQAWLALKELQALFAVPLTFRLSQ